MDDLGDPFTYNDSAVDQYNDYPEQDSSESADGRPSILITFQNSASYYTSYMGSNGGKGPGGRRKSSDVFESPVQQNNGHPIVVMNEYPNPGPVLVAVNSRKYNGDRCTNPFLNQSLTSGLVGPPGPTGPSGPPGPPGPNLPPSRRGSINMTPSTLEMPKKRRSSCTPGMTNPFKGSYVHSERLGTSRARAQIPNSLPVSRQSSQLTNFETSTLPRKPKMRPPRHSHSMPTLNEIGDCDFDRLRVPDPSPRPSVCSTANTEQSERRPLVPDQLPMGEEEWHPHNKPNWRSLNIDEEREKPRARFRSVYVAEIWPSLVCLLTAVLVTLTIYLLISYLFTQPLPSNTRNRIMPANPRYPYPGYAFKHYPYPYNPTRSENYPPPQMENYPPPPHLEQYPPPHHLENYPPPYSATLPPPPDP